MVIIFLICVLFALIFVNICYCANFIQNQHTLRKFPKLSAEYNFDEDYFYVTQMDAILMLKDKLILHVRKIATILIYMKGDLKRLSWFICLVEPIACWSFKILIKCFNGHYIVLSPSTLLSN